MHGSYIGVRYDAKLIVPAGNVAELVAAEDMEVLWLFAFPDENGNPTSLGRGLEGGAADLAPMHLGGCRNHCWLQCTVSSRGSTSGG